MSTQRHGEARFPTAAELQAMDARAAYQAAQPLPIAAELRELAEFCDLARQHPNDITLAGSLCYVRDELRKMAGRQR